MGAGIAVAAGIGAAAKIGGALLSKQSAPQEAPPVNLAATQASATAANQANLGASETLASQTNSFDQQQATALLNQALPGFSAAQASLMKASAMYQNNAVNGTLGTSQTNQIAQFAAEQGVSRGTSGQFNGFDVVKDFGENLQAYQQSQQNLALGTLSQAYGMAPKINPMSPSSQFVSPGQAIGVAENNQQAQQSYYNTIAGVSNQNASLLGNAVSGAGGLFSAYATGAFSGAPSGSAAGAVAGYNPAAPGATSFATGPHPFGNTNI